MGRSLQEKRNSHRTIKGMLNAGPNGKDQYLEFIQESIETNEVDFYEPIKQNKLHTFE